LGVALGVGSALWLESARAAPALASSPSFAADAPIPKRPAPRATDAAPWLGVAVGSFYVSRLSVPVSVGPELGFYAFRRLRVTGRLLVPLVQHDQCEDFNVLAEDETGLWWCIPSGKTKIAYGASLGYAILNDAHWAFSPGLAVLGTDLDEPGVLLAISAPIEWVTSDGLHVSFEVAGGPAVAQNTRVVCGGGFGGTCTPGATKEREFPLHTGGFATLTLAWGIALRQR
jgi:hypothetical protein